MSSEARFCNLPELAEQSVLLLKFYINSRVSEGLGSGPRFCDLADLADGFPPSSSWIHVTIEFHDERLRKANENTMTNPESSGSRFLIVIFLIRKVKVCHFVLRV